MREAPVGPTNRPPKPARQLPTKGKKTMGNKWKCVYKWNSK